MVWFSIKIGINDEGRRIDRVMRKFLPKLPLSLLYKEMRRGTIRINQKKISPDYRISSGDELFILRKLAEQGISQENPEKKNCALPFLEVLFENEHILIINKPYNIPVHGGGTSFSKEKEKPLDIRVRERYSACNTDSLSFRPGPLHRLDKKTTGVLAFSRSLAGARWFTKAIEEHQIGKLYLGIAEGCLDACMQWTDSFQKDFSSAFTVVRSSENGKSGITKAYPIACGKNAQEEQLTLMCYRLITGRTHQIRFQSSFHGLPLWGDSAYGSKPLSGEYKQDFFLHAQMLIIPSDNPIGLPQTITAPVPSAFLYAIKDNFPEKTYTELAENDIISVYDCYNSDKEHTMPGEL